MTLGLIAALPFLGALLPGLLMRFGRSACAVGSAAFTAAALWLLVLQAPAVLHGDVVQQQIAWVPSLGLNLNFMLDGLGLFFAGLILGIGLLISLYARFYLAEKDNAAVFYTYLMLFQGAMLGIVLSDNILLLLVFWELTSLSSFLLIGYWSHLPEGRRGARMALAVTGSGGLAMIAGMLILGHIAGSYDLSVILTKGEAIRASALYLPALLLIALGAFTKSAQFPFHFWLPHAMAAPTPVSAYLHSATMVKAGIFLLARMWPVLAGTEAWVAIVATTGLVTLLVGATVALFKDDLKAVLAYSTISHLGLITFLLGLGTKSAAIAAMVHILCHATFKAALFMLVGVVDHAVHSRRVSDLGGLRQVMPLTFGLTAVASLSMAGFPPLNGFLSKELMLDEAAHTVWADLPWLVPLLAGVGAMLSVGYSLRLLGHAFLGAPRTEAARHAHDPQLGLWLAPAVLVALCVAIGLAPALFAGWIVDAASSAVIGDVQHTHLALWHGWDKPALWISLAAIFGGFVLYANHARLQSVWNRRAKPDAQRMFDSVISGAVAASRAALRLIDSGTFARFVAIGVVSVAAAAAWAFFSSTHSAGTRPPTPAGPVAFAIWALLMAFLLAAVFLHRNRLLSLLLVGGVGLFVSLGFVFMAAPDLALTQITVEVVTIILMLVALNFFPETTPLESSRGRRGRDAGVAVVAGLGMGALAYAMLTRNAAFTPISAFHLAQSKPGAGGYNAVNTIIVDFRGYDTYGEIIVLGIAALVIFALTQTLFGSASAVARIAANTPPEGRAGDRHPLIFVVGTRVLLPLLLMTGVFIFLRGHNLPGGGFVAGLVFAIGFVMQYVASGQAWTQNRQRINFHSLIGAGVLVATATGAASWLAGRPFLTSSYGYIHAAPLPEFEWATAAAFDLGVFLCVLGAVMLALSSLSRLARRGGEKVANTPFDVNPQNRGAP